MPALCALKEIPQDRVILVAGPTASGKSRLAFLGAIEEGGVIINGDSIQMYQGLPLLAASPSLKEQEQVPHKLYGVLPSSYQKFSVKQWYNDVHTTVKQEVGQEKKTFVVGGSGFYLKTLEQGFSPLPEIAHEFKHRFRQEHDHFSFDELKKKLGETDPFLGEKIKDKQRATHALMVFYATGKPLSYWQALPHERSPHSFYKVLIWPSMQRLMERATKRWDAMVEQGVLDEVRSFCGHPGWQDSPLSRALGVSEVVGVLEGRLSLSQASALYIQSVRSYIKRQRTWFRHQFAPHLVIPHGV
jgi:tRNA dimethylallyltransferase